MGKFNEKHEEIDYETFTGFRTGNYDDHMGFG